MSDLPDSAEMTKMSEAEVIEIMVDMGLDGAPYTISLIMEAAAKVFDALAYEYETDIFFRVGTQMSHSHLNSIGTQMCIALRDVAYRAFNDAGFEDEHVLTRSTNAEISLAFVKAMEAIGRIVAYGKR